MPSHSLLSSLFLVLAVLALFSANPSSSAGLFREYIGAEGKGVTFFEVPVNGSVEFHFILAFAIDYTTTSSPIPSDGRFNVFWDTANLGPAQVADVKRVRGNVKVALSLGGDSVRSRKAYFQPSSIASWVANAVSSLTGIIKQYNLDGIDVDYEHFRADPNVFAECFGQLITTLKKNRVISFASIAPFDNAEVQRHYLALWRKYGHAIDYVNFQFYAYDKGTTVSQFLSYFQAQCSNYRGGKVLVSFATDGISGGLGPEGGFFRACNTLKSQGRLQGIFIWSADDSKKDGFRYERQSQNLLAS